MWKCDSFVPDLCPGLCPRSVFVYKSGTVADESSELSESIATITTAKHHYLVRMFAIEAKRDGEMKSHYSKTCFIKTDERIYC